jgi:hypothetical protein
MCRAARAKKTKHCTCIQQPFDRELMCLTACVVALPGFCRITIPAAQLASMSNGAYFVRADITNYLGGTAHAVWTFTKAASGTAPVIVPLATGTVTYKVAEGVRVGVQLVAASVCSGKQVRSRIVSGMSVRSRHLPQYSTSWGRGQQCA